MEQRTTSGSLFVPYGSTSVTTDRDHRAACTTTTTTTTTAATASTSSLSSSLSKNQYDNKQNYPTTQQESDEQNFYWRFTDIGHVGELSRDGSVHATDEVFNSVSHLSAFFVSVLGSVLLISASSAQHAPWKIVSFSIYGASLCFLFAASTVHHAVTTTPKWELFFQMLDYLAIFPLIAGTFTPLCLVFLHSSVVGWSFFSVVWVLAIGSMCVVARLFEKTPKWMTMTAYVSLGWFGGLLCLFLYPTYLNAGGIALMILGGVIYTVGGVIYTTEKPNPIPGRFGFHELWHLFVIGGAATHWCLMYFYVLPYEQPTTN
jgi:hemolysin III